MTSAGKIKILILAILAVANLLLFTSPPSKIEIIFPILSGLLTGFVGVLLKSALNAGFSKQRYSRPSWNDELFKSGNVLSKYLFVSSFFIILGLCISIKTKIIHQGISLPGTVSLAFGIGILLGTYLSFFLFKTKLNLK